MSRFVLASIISLTALSVAAQQNYVFRPLGQDEQPSAQAIVPGWRLSPETGRPDVPTQQTTNSSRFVSSPSTPKRSSPTYLQPSPYRYKPKSPNQTGSRPVDLSTLPTPEMDATDFAVPVKPGMAAEMQIPMTPSQPQTIQQPPVIEGRYTRHLDPLAGQYHYDGVHHFRPLEQKSAAENGILSSARSQAYPYLPSYQPGGGNPYMMPPNPYMPMGYGYPYYPNRHSGPSFNGFHFPFIK